jgi:hypothetical protein
VRIQVVSPQAGLTAFAHETKQYPLPPGLAHGTRVTVIERFNGPDMLVRDDAGREFTIVLWQCDCGSNFKWGNEWKAPHDPAIRAWLERELSKARRDDKTLAPLQDQLNEGHRELLERWGRLAQRRIEIRPLETRRNYVTSSAGMSPTRQLKSQNVRQAQIPGWPASQ